MKLSAITEMAAKKYCPNCGKTMAGHHYWYKGGWRCKGGGKSVDASEQKPAGAEPQNAIPPGFEEKIAGMPFGTEVKLKDGTQARFLGGGGSSVATPGESLYPVRVSSGPDTGQLLLIRPDEFDI